MKENQTFKDFAKPGGFAKVQGSRSPINCDSRRNRLPTCDFMTFDLFKAGGFARGSFGFSLVEILFAMLILSVLVLGSSAILYQAGGTIAIQNNKRAAISAASSRLEQLGQRLYENIRSDSGNGYYIDINDDIIFSPPDNTVLVNGQPRAILVSAETIFQTLPNREFVRIEAKVQYRDGDNWIKLSTNIR